MITELSNARAKVDEFLGYCQHPLLGRSMHVAAVLLAEDAERIGEEYDTRKLAEVLTLALQRACEANDARGKDLYAAQLLAVLSDLADMGDEDQAQAVNQCVASLSPYRVGLARACSATRREAANV